MKLPWKKVIVLGVMVAILIGCLGYLGHRIANVTKTSTYRIGYKVMPADDKAIAEWLRVQPGVKEATVSRDGDTLVLVFVMAGSSRDPEPAIVPVGEKFGYGGWSRTESTMVLSPLLS